MTKQPATVYDYRRVVTLVQVLAMGDPVARNNAIIMLYEQWIGQPVPTMDDVYAKMIHALSKHALEQGRANARGDYRAARGVLATDDDEPAEDSIRRLRGDI